MDCYPYTTPPGYGDTFYIYAFDSDNTINPSVPALTPGNNYYNQRIVISDGAFIARWWKGLDTLGNIAQSLQIRDHLQNQWFSNLLSSNLSTSNLMPPYMSTGWPVLPEKWYPDSGYIGFDLIGVQPNGAQVCGQLAFGGVRRRKGWRNDPVPSLYAWYEKEYQYQVTFTVPAGWSNKSGGYLVSLPITDFDFELRRIDGFGGNAGIAATYVYDDEVGPYPTFKATAVTTGAAGNGISIYFPNTSTPSQPLTFTVVGDAITVNFATNSGGAITTTIGAMVTAMNANPAVSALITAATSNPGDSVAGLAEIGAPVFLMGGSGGAGGGYAGLDPGNFKILLLDTNKIQTSNIPLLWSNLIHVPQTAPVLTNTSHSVSVPENFWPTPPMLYRNQTSLNFYIYVTSATPLAQSSTWDFVFTGVRRYNCK